MTLKVEVKRKGIFHASNRLKGRKLKTKDYARYTSSTLLDTRINAVKKYFQANINARTFISCVR